MHDPRGVSYRNSNSNSNSNNTNTNNSKNKNKNNKNAKSIHSKRRCLFLWFIVPVISLLLLPVGFLLLVLHMHDISDSSSTTSGRQTNNGGKNGPSGGDGYNSPLSIKHEWALSSSSSSSSSSTSTVSPLLSKQHPRKQENMINTQASLPQTPELQPSKEGRTSIAPWRTSKMIPVWMKEYFQWHQDSLENMKRKDNGNFRWNKNYYKYMIVQCLNSDGKCGGAADRLKPLPYYILVAYKLHRLLFFKWQRPASLEEFLVPPAGDGMDWRWPPPSIAEHFNESLAPAMIADMSILDDLARLEPTVLRKYKDERILTVKVQSHFHGMWEYDALRVDNTTEATYSQVFRDCWYSVFVPSPAVQAKIDSQVERLHLPVHNDHEKPFLAIHLRTQYLRPMPRTKVLQEVTNSINCIFALQKCSGFSDVIVDAQTQIFVASDAKSTVRLILREAHSRGLVLATSLVVQTNSTNTSTSISTVEGGVGTEEEEEEDFTLHLDRGIRLASGKEEEWTSHEIPRYYDTFVDVYLLSYSKCIVVNIGNYGKWANLLSQYPVCYIHTNDKRCAAFAGSQVKTTTPTARTT